MRMVHSKVFHSLTIMKIWIPQLLVVVGRGPWQKRKPRDLSRHDQISLYTTTNDNADMYISVTKIVRVKQITVCSCPAMTLVPRSSRRFRGNKKLALLRRFSYLVVVGLVVVSVVLPQSGAVPAWSVVSSGYSCDVLFFFCCTSNAMSRLGLLGLIRN